MKHKDSVLYTDSTTGIQYLGQKALRCHNIDPSNAVEWPKVAVFKGFNWIHNPDELVDKLDLDTSRIVDTFPVHQLPHRQARICASPRRLTCYAKDSDSCTDLTLGDNGEKLEQLCQKLNAKESPVSDQTVCKASTESKSSKGFSYLMQFTDSSHMTFTSTSNRENWRTLTCSVTTGKGGLVCGKLTCRGGGINIGNICLTPNLISIRFSLEKVDEEKLLSFLNRIKSSFHTVPGLEVKLFEETISKLDKASAMDRNPTFKLTYQVTWNNLVELGGLTVPATIVTELRREHSSVRGLPNEITVCYEYSPELVKAQGDEIHLTSVRSDTPRWEKCQTVGSRGTRQTVPGGRDIALTIVNISICVLYPF